MESSAAFDARVEELRARKAELRQKVKNYAELDDALAATASRIMGAAMQGRGFVFMRARPSATSARFSSRMGMRSATVPKVAKSV